MKLHFRKPELIPTLFMGAAVALMFSLGIWQLERLQWKNALLATIDAAQRQAPQPLLSYPEDALAGAEWHNVIVTGKLLNDKELYATPRYLNDQMGYAVLTPLEITTPKGKRYVLINRGWVSPQTKDPHTRKEGNPKGLVNVSGILRSTFRHNRFVPANEPQKNLWFWYDLPAMSNTLNLPLLPVMIDATDNVVVHGAPLSVGPKPFPIEIKLRNDHLGYAITWFLIGISGIVIYGIYYRKK